MGTTICLSVAVGLLAIGHIILKTEIERLEGMIEAEYAMIHALKKELDNRKNNWKAHT